MDKISKPVYHAYIGNLRTQVSELKDNDQRKDFARIIISTSLPAMSKIEPWRLGLEDKPSFLISTSPITIDQFLKGLILKEIEMKVKFNTESEEQRIAGVLLENKSTRGALWGLMGDVTAGEAQQYCNVFNYFFNYLDDPGRFALPTKDQWKLAMTPVHHKNPFGIQHWDFSHEILAPENEGRNFQRVSLNYGTIESFDLSPTDKDLGRFFRVVQTLV